MRVAHVILTRFNCRFLNWDYPARRQPGWLAERFDLFERYCLPTLKSQTSQDFYWMIYFDSGTPASYAANAKQLFDGYSNIHMRFVDVFSAETLELDLKSVLGGRYDWLVSTRLDNDDGLNSSFMERLRREIHPGRREAINFPNGLILGKDKIYLSRQPSNAFLSLSEPFEGFKTALCAPHKDMKRHSPVRDVNVGPMWLQVVHGNNVSNKLRGRRLLRRSTPQGFESVAELRRKVTDEAAVAVLAENLTRSVYWAGRDTAAQLYRRLQAWTRDR